MSEWQPIDTAPRDGTVILLARNRTVVAGWWSSDEQWTRLRSGANYPWCHIEDASAFHEEGSEAADTGLIEPNGFQDGWEGPTHWMPLPRPPKEVA